MNIDFPASPADGQTFQALNGLLYRYQAPPGLWAATHPEPSLAGIFDVRDYGASPSLADNNAAVASAIEAAFSAGGGTVYFPPGSWKLLTGIVVLDGVALRGVPGQTTLDFSAMDHWETSWLQGLIQARGTVGTPVAITHSTHRTTLTPRQFDTTTAPVTSITRSGTTVTARVNVRHVFVVGDPIWVLGIPSSAGQEVFFTVKYFPGETSLTARTNAFIVSSVIDDYSFTYEVPVAYGDTVLTDTGNTDISYASDTLMVADTSAFFVGQYVMVRSNQWRHSGGPEHNFIGEIAKVSRIVSPTQMQLQADVQDDYTIGTNYSGEANNPQVVPLTLHKNFSVSGFHLIGKGPQPNPPPEVNMLGDRGVVAYLCLNPQVRDCTFTDVDYTCILFWSSVGGVASENILTFNTSDEAGSVSGALDIQYGVAFAGATVGLVITNNVVWGGRHAAVETFNSAATGGPYYGTCRHITIHANTFKGQWLASVATHQGCDTITITNNQITSNQGIDPRMCRDVIVANNTITAADTGILVYNNIGNVVISGNTIRAQNYPIYFSANATLEEPFGPAKIINNQTEGGRYGIFIDDATPGRKATDIDISGNTIYATTREAAYVLIGDVTATADGWYGRINNNSFISNGREGNLDALRLTNMKGGQVNDNIFTGTFPLNYAIYLFGAGTGDGLQFMNNYVQPGLVTVRTFGGVSLSTVGGNWHLTNMPQVNATDSGTVTAIAAGVATPRFARSLLVIDGEGGVADDLDTLAAGFIGQTVILRAFSNSRVITVRDNMGNIQTAGSVARVLDSIRDTLTLVWDGSAWIEVAFSSSN